MKINYFWNLLLLGFSQLQVHEHGEHLSREAQFGGYEKWIKWIGNFHPIVLHFPIALIVMTVIAELLSIKSSYPIFKQAARFMIIAAAITALPTVILGLAYGYGASYEDPLILVFWWHRFLGISTAILAIITAIFKELHVRNKMKTHAYTISLSFLFIFVTVTGYLGGEMTFGLFHLLP